ncbi:MAG: TauD/TfdA family dioxygenase [Planctomycetota bacterium]|nr:TauD/TfdA family dioxygenase [Planctomycetota bacterium]
MSISAVPLKLPLEQDLDGKPFPFALQCSGGNDASEAAQWAAEQAEELIKSAASHGAVFLRGLPLQTPEDLDAFVSAFGLPNFSYADSLSNAHRINFTPRVFSANEAPGELTIFLHHEMAQTPNPPARLFFFCQEPAPEGGATPLCRSDILWKEICSARPEFASACKEKGLRYSNVMPGQADEGSTMGRSWQSTLSSESRSEAESRLQKLGYTWQWLDDGSLRATTPVLPAVRKTADGRAVFFNQLIAAFQGWKDDRNDPRRAVTFGDGATIDPADVHWAAEAADRITFDLPWQRGDLAIVDNYLTMHGRRTFSGSRRVLASLSC